MTHGTAVRANRGLLASWSRVTILTIQRDTVPVSYGILPIGFVTQGKGERKTIKGKLKLAFYMGCVRSAVSPDSHTTSM